MRQRMNNRGQAAMSEYLVVFFLAIGAIITMTVYVQRTLQGRIRDAKIYMLVEASNAHESQINAEYEPYYGYLDSVISREQDDTSSLLPGGATGIFRKRLDQAVITNSTSRQAPPKDAK